jgi:hypothetical protein
MLYITYWDKENSNHYSLSGDNYNLIHNICAYIQFINILLTLKMHMTN